MVYVCHDDILIEGFVEISDHSPLPGDDSIETGRCLCKWMNRSVLRYEAVKS